MSQAYFVCQNESNVCVRRGEVNVKEGKGWWWVVSGEW
jgi:hypothetical protein